MRTAYLPGPTAHICPFSIRGFAMLAVPCSCAITYTLRMADSADLKDRLEDFLGRELGAPVSVTDLVRLPGGASRETWSLTASGPAGEMRLVLRRDPPT